MKRIVALFGVFLCAVLGAPVIWGATNSIEIGPSVSHISYEEPGLMKESGMMYGIEGAYTFKDALYLRFNGRAAFGSVDYSSPLDGTIGDISDMLIETSGVIGHKILGVYPYIGFGYRYLSDDMAGKQTTTGALGYLRESNYYYVPIGIHAEATNKNGLYFSVEPEIDGVVGGKQESHLGAIPGFPNVRNYQPGGFGYKLTLSVGKKGKMDISAGTFIHYWKIQESSADSGFVEPKNNSTEVGAQILIKF